jgi:hypothetical protein
MGLSVGKLFILALLGLIVWYGFKYRRRVDAVRRAFEREFAKGRKPPPPPPPPARVAAVDLVPCERCGAYVASRGAAPCTRADCPWRA